MDFSILSRYDDFLANYFLDSLILWFPTIRMNSDLACGMVDTKGAIPIIRQRIAYENNPAKASKEFIQLPLFQEFLKNKGDRQIFEFTQHMRRYMCMFMPNAGFEVGCTTRYTGEKEACIIATQDWKVGDKVALCQGSIAKLTAEEDEILKSEGRDFSVMVSTRKKCACLFLGPARFMNHDCDANCEFILVGSNAVTFKVNRNIKCGEEMTVFYGKHYFGEDNCECLCASCERRQEGGFSISEKTVVELPAEEIILSSTRSGSRKRKENIDGHDYASERVSKKSMLNHTNSDQQKPLTPVDENQYAPTNIVVIDEDELQESQSQCIPEKMTNNSRHIVIVDDDMLESNNDSQKENATVSEMILDTITAEKSKLEAMHTSTPSGDIGNLAVENSRPLEIGDIDVEESGLVVEKELVEITSSNDDGNENENSVEDAKVPLTQHSEKSNEQLVECNLLEEEETSQGSTPILSSTTSNDEKSVTPMSGTANIGGDDSSVEIDVDSLPVIDEGPSMGPNRVYDLNSNVSNIENTTTPILDEDDGELTEDHSTHSNNKHIQDTNKESTTEVMDSSKSQTLVDTDTLDSNRCKDTGIAFSEGFSEGFSDKAKLSSKTKKTTRVFKPENSIRQVRSVVINHESDKRLASKKIDLSSCRTVCDIWIPVNKYTKKKVNTTLQELNDDMQKMIDVEKTETEAHTAQDHSNSSKNIQKANPKHTRVLEYIYYESSSDEDEETSEVHEAVDKDKLFHAWPRSTSSSVCHNNDDDVSLRSETQSTYSINESENFSVPEEYTPNTEPEPVENNDNQAGNTVTCKDDSLQTINDRTSISSPTDSSSSSSSSTSNSLNDPLPPSAKSRFIELIDPPTAIIREEEVVVKEPKAINETTHFSFLRNMSDSTSQHEKEGVIVLDDLHRSYTSSSNDSVCFSSNDFDPTDMSSPLSVSSNDSILAKQDDMESGQQHGPDTNTTTELNSYSTKINSNSVFKESGSTEMANMKQSDTLNIPKEHESADISQSNSPRISTSVNPVDTTSISSSTTAIATTVSLDEDMDLNSTDILDTANSTNSIEISNTNNIQDSIDPTPYPAVTSSYQTNTMISVDASIPAHMTSILNFSNQTSTENTTKVSSISSPASSSSANLTPVKRCCPDFEKYTSNSDVNSTMCPRCLRHFNVYGVEWPKRIGKKRPKYKTKGPKSKNTQAESSKSNPKKDPRTKSNISKQRPKQKSPSTHESMDLDSSENTTGDSSEQYWRDEPESNDVGDHIFTFSSRPLKKSKNNNADYQSKDKEESVSLDIANKEESQSTSIPTPPITDQSETSSVPVTKPPRKRKPKRDYYYYKLVPIHEEPEPEQIIVNTDKPYGLRVNSSATHYSDNHNHQQKHQKKEKPKPTSSQLPKETDEGAAQPSNKNRASSTSKATVKKKKKRRSSPRITAKKRYRAGSRSSRSKTPVRNQTNYHPKCGYYEWVVVFEDDDSPEEIPINTDLSKPYNFRTRGGNKSSSETLSHGKKPQDNGPKNEEPSQDSTLEATLGSSSQQKEKLDQVTPQHSAQETKQEHPSCQPLNRHTQKSIKQKPKVSSNHVEKTEKPSRPPPIEKEIIIISPSSSTSSSSSSSSTKPRRIMTRSSSIITDRVKSDKPSDNVSFEKPRKHHPETERKINTRSSSKEKEKQVQAHEQPSETKNDSTGKKLATVISRNYNTRYSEKSAEPPVQQVMPGKPLKKVNIQQRNRFEATSSPATLEDKKKITKTKKRSVDSVEKSRVEISNEPPFKKPYLRQCKQSNVVAASAKTEPKIPSKPITRSSSLSKKSLAQDSNERIFKKSTTAPNRSEPVKVKYATRSKA